MGKAKPAHHTRKELDAKAFNATVNRGGGKQGQDDRKGGKVGHAKFQCPICCQQAPDIKSMVAHHESKHPKQPFDEEGVKNLRPQGEGTVTGVAVRGGIKKHHA
eukprot:321124_1